MTVGVVLGAGGPLGWAYHLGIVEGVRDAIGREPANADRIVGTSAGAAIAVSFVAGTPTDQVIAMISALPAGEDGSQLRSVGAAFRRNPLRALRPVAPNLVRCVRQVGGGPIRARARRTLDAECRSLEEAGTRTLVQVIGGNSGGIGRVY